MKFQTPKHLRREVERRWLRFLDKRFQSQFLELLSSAGVKFTVGKSGAANYDGRNYLAVEECAVELYRRMFKPFRTLACPDDWVHRYKGYMDRRHIPYYVVEEEHGTHFVIPKRFLPQQWKQL